MSGFSVYTIVTESLDIIHNKKTTKFLDRAVLRHHFSWTFLDTIGCNHLFKWMAGGIYLMALCLKVSVHVYAACNGQQV